MFGGTVNLMTAKSDFWDSPFNKRGEARNINDLL